MSHLTQAQLDELRQILEQKLIDLQSYTDSLDEEDPRSYPDRTTDNSEVGDEALEDYGIMENEALGNEVDQNIAEIKQALQRLDEGNYGLDQETNEPIPFARLKLYPTATTNVVQEN